MLWDGMARGPVAEVHLREHARFLIVKDFDFTLAMPRTQPSLQETATASISCVVCAWV